MKLRPIVLSPVWFALATMALVAGCGPGASETAAKDPAPAAIVPSSMKPIAGIQDIMASMIDPAADHLWESVSTVASDKGVEDKRPKTDEDWKAVRTQAVILTEAANLLMVEGRHVAKEGAALEDHGTPGNLTAAESQQAIAADRQAFVTFAAALRDVGAEMLKAADARNTQAIFDAGYPLDQVCENCHLKFWYPGAKALEEQQKALEAKK